MDYRVQQAIASSLSALAAIAAIWGLDLSWLNHPGVVALITAAAGALGSFLVPPPAKPKPPTLEEAYHAVQAAEQARDHERWRAAAHPSSLHDDDGFKRPD